MAKHYIAVFTIDGVEHTMRGYTDSPGLCRKHLQQILDSRNANQEMEDEVAELKKIVFDPSPGEANAIEEQVKNGQPVGMDANEIFPGEPARILHKSVPKTFSE